MEGAAGGFGGGHPEGEMQLFIPMDSQPAPSFLMSPSSALFLLLYPSSWLPLAWV